MIESEKEKSGGKKMKIVSKNECSQCKAKIQVTISDSKAKGFVWYGVLRGIEETAFSKLVELHSRQCPQTKKKAKDKNQVSEK